MNILITGASGFIGQYLVNEALERGDSVTALVRKNSLNKLAQRRELRILEADLLYIDPSSFNINDVDIAIHAAASMRGPKSIQYKETLSSTENLLNALDANEVTRLIGISSISVLDYVNLPPMSTVDEKIPINRTQSSLGPYGLMKRDQEYLFREWGGSPEKQVAIVRPGLVYDEENLSAAHVGFLKGRFGLAVNHTGEVPIVHAKSVASALISLAHINFDSEVIHLVNDHLPSQTEYLDNLKTNSGSCSNFYFIPVSWKSFALFARFIRLVMSLAGMGKHIPDSFRENSVAGRVKPLRFSNSCAKKLINWIPEKGIY